MEKQKRKTERRPRKPIAGPIEVRVAQVEDRLTDLELLLGSITSGVCPADGKPHEPIVVPGKGGSPLSKRPDRLIAVVANPSDPSTSGFRLEVAVCSKCGLVYCAEHQATDSARKAELDRARREVQRLQNEIAKMKAPPKDEPTADVVEAEDAEGDDAT